MASEVSICNVALSLLAVDLITSLDDDSQQAQLCKNLYPELRDAVLEDADWSFAIKRRTLVPTTTEPEWGYTYKYQIPSDSMRLVVVTDQPDFSENATYRLEWKKEANCIFTDAGELYIKYVRSVEDVSLFTAMFRQALSQRLAAELAIPLTESKQLYEMYMSMYERKRDDAATTDGTQSAGGTERMTSGDITSRR